MQQGWLAVSKQAVMPQLWPSGASCGLDTAVRTGTEVLLRQCLILWTGAGFLLNEAQIIETIRV